MSHILPNQREQKKVTFFVDDNGYEDRMIGNSITIHACFCYTDGTFSAEKGYRSNFKDREATLLDHRSFCKAS